MIEKLGKYEIRRMLGRGAMGVVYEGYDPLIKRSVALKTIRADQLQGDAAGEIIARFKREAEAVGRLNHPNIVSIYDFGEDAGTWYIAMELVHGRELKEMFEAGERFRLPDVVRIMSQILAALDYSHRQGVVHRDVKPANIFVLPDGTAKVTDFGIAYIESSNLTQVGTTIGTPSYMSPEQIMGVPIDGRSDIFSAGVILYQFLTGERPFAGSSNTTMQKVLKEDPLPPSSLNLQVPPAMDAVVRQALAKQADARFQSAQAFATALQAAATPASDPDATVLASDSAAGTPATANAVSVAPATSAASTGTAASTSSIPVTTVPGALPPAKPRNVLVPVAVVVAALAIGAGAWYASQRMSGDSPRAVQADATHGAGQSAVAAAAPAAPTTTTPSAPATVKPEPGTIVVSAVGLADPSNPRYQADKSLLQADVRADSRSQVVAKALGLMIDRKSLATNYDVLHDKLMANSGSYISTVLQESAPQIGKDGLMSTTTQAVVNVKALQKSLNQMSRDERIELIRAGGDPRIALRIAVRDADRPDVPPLPSPVAENIVKARIQSFGFRTWSDDAANAAPAGDGADFTVEGEAKVKKLSVRLEASGLVVSKYTLTSWTVKCIDRSTGEEVYFNTTLPRGVGSWPSEEEALKAIGTKIADEFSRDFFLAHVNVGGRKIGLTLSGMPDAASEQLVARELVGLPAVITLRPREPAGSHTYDVVVGGDGAPGDVVANDLLPPLNTKLGQACFALGGVTPDQATVTFDPRCADAAVIARLEGNPPAALYAAPPARQKAVVANPDARRKLMI
jgi:serine/threonine-protein kinase